jgi:hypothetical protein
MRDILIEIADIDDQIEIAKEDLCMLVMRVANDCGAESDELIAERIAARKLRLELLTKERNDRLESAIKGTRFRP